ncbi:MAG: malonate-semialdehyde dehydrogenase (acetylating)/methylmalonate-semialdehyde dehydrogenase [Gammaproteobacteria bacterium]|jgi:malonate-semialdehyde dehydrogenase (acetylating)/methylmalonate-semialdehyde dehydrogenase
MVRTLDKIQSEHLDCLGHYINGGYTVGTERMGDVYNPATGTVIKQVAYADAEHVDQAIIAAEQAFPAWRATTPINRARIMFRFKQLLEEHADEIIRLITEENGKVLDDARGEFNRGVEIIEYACGAPELLKGEYSKSVGTNIDSWSEFHPVGIVTGITPFNFPVMVPLWMYPMALICGNCFILKPSEKDPGSSLYIADLLQKAGLPDGVFNIVNGDKETVDLLLTDDRIAAVSFVGSSSIAEYIYKTGAVYGKRVQALGGAKNHAVVMPDANIDNTVKSLIGAAYGSCGERCMAISVVVCVGDDIADEMVKRLSNEIGQFKIGNGMDKGNDLGPLITKEHMQKVLSYIDIGVEEGASLVVDGRNYSVADLEEGFFIGGCLFDNVTPEMQICQEEIFGPVLCVVRCENLEQAMQVINQNPYGNGTCIFTEDGGLARYFSDNINVGMVGVNVPLPVPVAYHSFGGWKRSLFGDLSIYGPDSVRFYTRRKTISQRWSTDSLEKAQFSFPSNE